MARTTPGVTRRRILDEAVRLFATRGYDATSVADIQTACGLNPGSGALYKHFPSKAALLEAAVHDNLERLAARTPKPPTPSSRTTPARPCACSPTSSGRSWPPTATSSG